MRDDQFVSTGFVRDCSSLQKHSESNSSYKSHTTFKCFIGLQFYEGSISDKQIALRSGFLGTLKTKLLTAELWRFSMIFKDLTKIFKDEDLHRIHDGSLKNPQRVSTLGYMLKTFEEMIRILQRSWQDLHIDSWEDPQGLIEGLTRILRGSIEGCL